MLRDYFSPFLNIMTTGLYWKRHLHCVEKTQTMEKKLKNIIEVDVSQMGLTLTILIEKVIDLCR